LIKQYSDGIAIQKMKLNPELSKLAKKFLDVPASEADVE
jgi:hypothetical protein